MRFKIIFIFVFTLFCSFSVYAWNSVGHRVIAQIAYHQLTPAAKKQVDALTAVMFHSKYPSERFGRASTWPDRIKTMTPPITKYSSWHFINLPYVKDNIVSPTLNPKDNVVWAIKRAEKIVENKNEPIARRAKYLSFLVHFVGDISQPLHCTELYDKQFPHGDEGGNEYLIHSPISKDLHYFWDAGLGMFVVHGNRYHFYYKRINEISSAWVYQYPRSMFQKQLAEKSPMQWAKDSHQIAVNFVYNIPENTAPTQSYIEQGQGIVRKQIVLAGYRLADILNHIFAAGK